MRLISFVCAFLLLVGIPVGAAPAEEVRLTVSRLVLAYPQATEDIYCGTVPAQEITWQSENPAVIEVADGVVTALAPGETEITASWNGQVSTCAVSCLTGSQEEFQNFYGPERHQPMRTPVDPQRGPAIFMTMPGLSGTPSPISCSLPRGGRRPSALPFPCSAAALRSRALPITAGT